MILTATIQMVSRLKYPWYQADRLANGYQISSEFFCVYPTIAGLEYPDYGIMIREAVQFQKVE
jgi:hypothetical protein